MSELYDDFERKIRESRRRALQPFLFCSVPGLVLVFLAVVLDQGWLDWPGFALMLAAVVWAGVRAVKAGRRARESTRRFDEWLEQQGYR